MFRLSTCQHVVSNTLPRTDKILHKGLIPLSLAVLHHALDVFPASWVEQGQGEENKTRSHIGLELCNILQYPPTEVYSKECRSLL